MANISIIMAAPNANIFICSKIIVAPCSVHEI